jgi:hypothetical protein
MDPRDRSSPRRQVCDLPCGGAPWLTPPLPGCWKDKRGRMLRPGARDGRCTQSNSIRSKLNRPSCSASWTATGMSGGRMERSRWCEAAWWCPTAGERQLSPVACGLHGPCSSGRKGAGTRGRPGRRRPRSPRSRGWLSPGIEITFPYATRRSQRPRPIPCQEGPLHFCPKDQQHSSLVNDHCGSSRFSRSPSAPFEYPNRRQSVQGGCGSASHRREGGRSPSDTNR